MRIHTWVGLRFSDASWLGPVWFGLFPRPVLAGSGINLLKGSVWFGSAVSVRFLIPCWKITCRHTRASILWTLTPEQDVKDSWGASADTR